MNQEEIQNLVRESLDEYMEDYFAMRRPGFNIESNCMTQGHGRAEFELNTDNVQGVHWYEDGTCKVGSNKSIEVYTGDKQKEGELAVVIEASKGGILIKAPNGNLTLQGQNILIETTAADGDLTIKSKKTVTIESPEYNVSATKCNQTASSDMLLTAGTLGLYSETGATITGSGQDTVLSPNVLSQIVNFVGKHQELGRFI